jgi:hypoxanthine phosphoribosyltransferase
VTHPAVELLIPRSELQARIGELAAELEPIYRPVREPPLVIGVLKGSTMFLADLVRALEVDVALDFISISSYSDSGTHSGVVRILKDLETNAADRDVVLVEDIVDTGLTLTYLRRTLYERGVRSLRTVSLLDKAARRIVPVELEHRGFEIPDVFVVGYGLDFQGLYRNIPDILAVRDIARLANDPRLLVEPLWDAGSGLGE